MPVLSQTEAKDNLELISCVKYLLCCFRRRAPTLNEKRQRFGGTSIH